MTARSLIALAALALFALAGCGGDDAASPALKGPLVYERSGGFAGETQTLTIQPSGAATLVIDRGTKNESKDFKLDPGQLKRITELADETDLASVKVEKAAPAADAFKYSISYDGERCSGRTGKRRRSSRSSPPRSPTSSTPTAARTGRPRCRRARRPRTRRRRLGTRSESLP